VNDSTRLFAQAAAVTLVTSIVASGGSGLFRRARPARHAERSGRNDDFSGFFGIGLRDGQTVGVDGVDGGMMFV
jgi:hypothetical protein